MNSTEINELGERLQKAFSDAYNLIPKERPELKTWCYLSIFNHESKPLDPKPVIWLSGLSGFEIQAESLPDLLSKLGNSDPVSLQMERIRKAETQLHQLREKLAEMEGEQ